LSTISHELRTPLAVIKMAIQMLEITLDKQMPSSAAETSAAETRVQSQSVEQYVKILREQCNQELALVNDILVLQPG